MIEIIPAIDIMGGECVRLTQGDFARKTVYSADPVETAISFEAAGVTRLHMVDLDGAKSGRPRNLAVLGRVASRTDLIIDYGGGLRSEADVRSVLDAGAAVANVGSFAIREPDVFLRWIEKFGGERILLGADVREGKIAIDGWQTDTRIPVSEVLDRFVPRGVSSVFVTDIGRDGAMAGPSTGLYREILGAFPNLRLIASGGVASIGDVRRLERAGCSGVIVGKAIYEGRISLEDLKNYAG